jgi:hypothetical protein
MSIIKLETKSYKLRNKLYLNVHDVKGQAQVENQVRVPLNHVFCCDVSGSMYSSLPKMRQQLKNRISAIVDPADTITIIAFSSPNVCYVLKELAKVNTPEELSELQAAIDRYLVPNGWTDFVHPIQATEKLMKSYDGPWNWIFLSDGGHNDGPFSDVMNALAQIQDDVCAATIIEYGYYADSANLSRMAESLSGTKIMAADFDHYVPEFEAAVSGVKSAKMVEVDVSEFEDSLKHPQFVYIDENTKTIHVTSPKGGKVVIPEYVNHLCTISTKVVGANQKSGTKPELKWYYAAIYVMSDLLHYDLVDSLLSSLGDMTLINDYQDAYGKQALFAFQNEVMDFLFNPDHRGAINEEYEAPESKYCVIDFMTDLMQGDNYIKVVSPEFKYNRIGAKSVDKVELTDEEAQKLAKAKTKAQAEKVLDAAKERSVEMKMIDKGYPVSNFTWNEERANLSALMNIDVELTLPKNDVGLQKIQSFVFRNYTIIKDGVLNINQFPVIIDQTTLDKVSNYVASDVIATEEGHYECLLDISRLPIINRSRIRASKKAKMTKLALELLDYKFQLKYLGYLKKELGATDTSSGRLTGYTADQLEYLESLGITLKNGYSPKKEVVKSDDYYMALTLNSNFKSFSSIPKIEDIDKKLKAGKKLTPAEEYLQLVMAYVDKKYLSNAKGQAYKDAIKSAFTSLSIKKNAVQEELAKMKFAMIISRKWFSDCESFDDNTDTIKSSFGPDLTIEYRFTEKKQNL